MQGRSTGWQGDQREAAAGIAVDVFNIHRPYARSLGKLLIGFRFPASISITNLHSPRSCELISYQSWDLQTPPLERTSLDRVLLLLAFLLACSKEKILATHCSLVLFLSTILITQLDVLE